MIPLYYFRYPRLHFRPGGYVGVLGVQADPAYLMKEVVGPEEYPWIEYNIKISADISQSEKGKVEKI